MLKGELMNPFHNIISNIKAWWNSLWNKKDILEKLNIVSAQSDIMNANIELWSNIYAGKPTWLSDGEITLNLAAFPTLSTKIKQMR